MSFFGSGKPKQPVQSTAEVQANMSQRESQLEAQINAKQQELIRLRNQINTAKSPSQQEFLKKQALQVIKQRKMIEQQLSTLRNQSIGLQQMQFATENVLQTTQTMQTMQVASKAMSKEMKNVNVAKMEKMMDQMQDMQERAQDMTDMLNDVFDTSDQFEDEAELEAELSYLADEIMIGATVPSSNISVGQQQAGQIAEPQQSSAESEINALQNAF
ncbi:putative Charged multivesicular body protein 5 [Blattamonas nauphoetae]|uniref:Charged multivesicular body protein 5 n=1 Tax=Blattamonas nauphoetae TaxID=2049346 RepID=A0ABQ9YFL9_9EUKA|nr:putative Charged multivesicular body protein 5 [Blattamonas nauphoetae]